MGLVTTFSLSGLHLYLSIGGVISEGIHEVAGIFFVMALFFFQPFLSFYISLL
jgi:hypothetical protein